MEEQLKRLYRSRKDKIIDGVCGGLGEYFGIEPLLFRIVFVVLAFLGGIGVLLYFILMIIIPKEPIEGEVIEGKDKVKGFAEDVSRGVQSVAEEVAKEAKSFAANIKKSNWFSDRQNILGIIIIVVGFYLLINQFINLRFAWRFFWPIVVMLIGLYIIFRKS